MTPSETALPDLGELRRLAEAATPGPWHSCRDEFGCGTVAPGVDCSSSQSFVATEIAETPDADYIAAAHPQAVLALLDHIERLRALLVSLEPAIAYAIAHTWTPEQIAEWKAQIK